MAETELEVLLRAAIAGDHMAYRRFLVGLVPVLRRAAASAVPSTRRDLIEDVVQETMLVVHMKRASWDGARPLMAWLNVILRHKAIDLLRRLPRAPHDPLDQSDSMALAAPATDPIARPVLEQLLERLSARDQALIRGHALEGMTDSDLCQAHGLTPGALRVALHRALGRLAALAREKD
jgi:RNA polymerase sigma-70 factor (ECF subfamily)